MLGCNPHSRYSHAPAPSFLRSPSRALPRRADGPAGAGRIIGCRRGPGAERQTLLGAASRVQAAGTAPGRRAGPGEGAAGPWAEPPLPGCRPGGCARAAPAAGDPPRAPGAARMQHPLELGAARYFPAEAFPDHRSHRYRSFMIEEILTDPPDAKGAAPAGELLKFGVQALLSARPYHNHLGTSRGAPRGWGWQAGRHCPPMVSSAFGSRVPWRKTQEFCLQKLLRGSDGHRILAGSRRAAGAPTGSSPVFGA